MHANQMGEGAFYSPGGNPGEGFFARFHNQRKNCAGIRMLTLPWNL